ncbi:MAG: HAMP domain-containing histidine kinase [Candidatus Gastranaerophilales bacterium]|nr:HAMP domain-containing histidine kinase [Candidatus Gastranaerophilales bacterium]
MNNNIKDEFISTLSHEIRTPLTSIKGFCQTMISSWDKLDDNKKQDFLKIILAQSQRLIDLCENVLNVAKIDSNSDNLILSKIDVNNILQNCTKVIQMTYKNFEFVFDLSKNELFSLCDNDKTQQILLNILDNALKYSQNSNQIMIKTSNLKDFNVISIKNFGSFIAKDDMDKIFDKFYRVDSYMTSTTQGSGLGLYIAQNLAQKMNGKIEVQSNEKEKWTEFSIYLPVWEIEAQTKNIKG